VGGVYHNPAATKFWVEELRRFNRHRRETISGDEYLWRQSAVDLALSDKFLYVLKNKPENIIALPVFSTLIEHTLTDVAEGREPSTRILLVGEGGVGKTTAGFYLMAVPWGMAMGLCEGELGRVSFDPSRDEPPFADWEVPPSIDCRFGHGLKQPPAEWEWVMNAIVFTVEDLAERLRQYVAELMAGRLPRYWAFMFDEVGSSDMSAASFFLVRHRYAASSMLVPLIRTASPHSILTTTSSDRVQRAFRGVTNYVAYMTTLPPKGEVVKRYFVHGSARDLYAHSRRALHTHGHPPYDVVSIRLDSTAPAYGSAERPRTRLMQGRAYMLKGSAKMPSWYYSRNLEFRLAVVEHVKRVLQEKEQKKKKRLEEEEEWEER
jgi:hypothetical protein